MSRRNTSIVAAVCLVIFLGGSAALLHHSDQIRPTTAPEDALYIDSPKFLKRASLGYQGLLADIYWTRAVQYFGVRHHNHATN